jgi:hypothetical protein
MDVAFNIVGIRYQTSSSSCATPDPHVDVAFKTSLEISLPKEASKARLDTLPRPVQAESQQSDSGGSWFSRYVRSVSDFVLPPHLTPIIMP